MKIQKVLRSNVLTHAEYIRVYNSFIGRTMRNELTYLLIIQMRLERGNNESLFNLLLALNCIRLHVDY